MSDEQQIADKIGFLAEQREGFFISCWNLFVEETAAMWKEYGKDGVAICSRYSLLKSFLSDTSERAYLGLVQYGSKHLTGWNIFRFITTKRLMYAHEKEVRAFLWRPDCAGRDRRVDANNRFHDRPCTPPPPHIPQAVRLIVDLQILLTGVVISPIAPATYLSDVKKLIHLHGYSIPVRTSELMRFKNFLP